MIYNVIYVILATDKMQAIHIYQFWHLFSWEYWYDEHEVGLSSTEQVHMYSSNLLHPSKPLRSVFFQIMVTLIAALSVGAKTYLRCNFSIFFFNDFTERLDGCLNKCGCLLKLSILMSIMSKNSFSILTTQLLFSRKRT